MKSIREIKTIVKNTWQRLVYGRQPYRPFDTLRTQPGSCYHYYSQLHLSLWQSAGVA